MTHFFWVASSVKISNHFDHISVAYIQNNTQKQPKLVLCAGTWMCVNGSTAEGARK